MKTSGTQFNLMIEFMERNGDLSKPATHIQHGRPWVTKKWQELAALLNGDPSGSEKSEEKWRKVWSDFKNSCKKKVARINKSINGTGGGPALTSHLTDAEQRVVAMVGIQAAIGLDVEEVGFGQVETHIDTKPPTTTREPALPDPEDWNMPGTSQSPPHFPGEVELEPPLVPEEKAWEPPKKKKKKEEIADLYIQCEKDARERERERDDRFYEIERERIRQRDIELQQRDRELTLQAQWLQFMRDGMSLLERFLYERS
ncbi:uncharacterized protein LOC105382825 [Plutella xylostella]|uniref:uncharacterized protein LOC105382825 n=1 Tax=Plutella xylostella TaxID=51655 RepID=UPI0018D013D4|nr:uncharacterized protein LOC105382825 [Plutella xylostella]